MRIPASAHAHGVVLVAVALLLVHTAPGGSSRTAGDEAPDEVLIVRALEVKPGQTVAEIGAGDGALTIAMARRVAESGRVFTSELGEDRIRKLRDAVEESKLANVTVVEADAMRTNLPASCCDAIFMRAVYHHFSDPPVMNASLLASLKPGGLLAVLDFGPPPGKPTAKPSQRASDGSHGVTAETARAELQEAGFELVASEARPNRGFMVVMRKPR